MKKLKNLKNTMVISKEKQKTINGSGGIQCIVWDSYGACNRWGYWWHV